MFKKVSVLLVFITAFSTAQNFASVEAMFCKKVSANLTVLAKQLLNTHFFNESETIQKIKCFQVLLISVGWHRFVCF